MTRALVSFLLLAAGAAQADIVVVPHPDEMCAPGKTVVWTGALQSAFDRVIGDKAEMTFAKVTPENPLITRMRTFDWEEDKTLPAGGWFAVAGKDKPKLAEEATARWRELAGPDEPSFEFDSPNDGSYAAIAGIFRNFQFRKAFIPSISTTLAWNGGAEQLKFFGARGEDMELYGDSVRMLAYEPAHRVQALQFLAAEGDDTMILYTPPRAQSMMEAMTWVRKWRERWDGLERKHFAVDDKLLHVGDDFRAPEISFDVRTTLEKLFEGVIHFENPPHQTSIHRVEAKVSMKVDAMGVTVRSTATIDPFASTPQPRRFWFDRPFFLFLWRDGATLPYVGVWFGTAEGFITKPSPPDRP